MRLVGKHLFFLAGLLFFALGVIGVFIPLLPTTPFLLLAAACFFRSSARLYHWIMHHRVFGSHISGYRQFHAISKKAKILSLVMLWSVIVSSAFIFTTLVWIRVSLLVIAVSVTIYLLHLRTLTQEMIDQSEP